VSAVAIERADGPIVDALLGLYGWKPGEKHWFVPERDHDTVWEVPRPKASREHPTMKPVELVRRALSLSSRRDDTVLDPFLGSGSMLIAAETIGRRCLGIEIYPRYAQAAIERWQAFTGSEAVRG
jgi:site-specific DNA-methyltransferase (adenine-specific)